MALYQLDRRGTYYDDLRAGTIASMLANINRDTKAHPDAWGPLDFMHWNEHHEAQQSVTPILLDDPDAHSDLMFSMLFPKRA